MSSYLATEAALLTLCRAYNSGATFTSGNSSRDDWTVIDTAATSLLVEMGEETQEGVEEDGYSEYGTYQERHTVDIWIAMKRSEGQTGDGTLKQSLKTLTEALKDYLRPYRRLNNATGVRSFEISTTLPPAYVTRERGQAVANASHMTQRIRTLVYCSTDAPVGETDG